MEHEKFEPKGFEFMDEPATEQQKDIFCQLARELGRPVKREGPWPNPFTKWDAACAIEALERQKGTILTPAT